MKKLLTPLMTLAFADLLGGERPLRQGCVPVLLPRHGRPGPERGNHHRCCARGQHLRQHFDCYEEDAPASQGDIQAWVAELGFSQPQETTSSETEETDMESTQIAVTCGDVQVVYALNDSPAAQSLLSQLPLTVEVEDFSTNEKVFYPPQELDTANTPLAEGGAGTWPTTPPGGMWCCSTTAFPPTVRCMGWGRPSPGRRTSPR